MLQYENYIEDDFQEFLDQKSFEEAEACDVISEDLVNYYISRIKKNKEAQKMYEERAKNIIAEYSDKVKLWRDKHNNSIEEDIAYCLGKLEGYFEVNAKNDESKLRFPEGSIGFYKTRTSVKFDDEALLEFALDSEQNKSVFRDFLEFKPSINTKSLRNTLDLDPENGIASINGIIIPGVKVSGGNKKFDVR